MGHPLPASPLPGQRLLLHQLLCAASWKGFTQAKNYALARHARLHPSTSMWHASRRIPSSPPRLKQALPSRDNHRLAGPAHHTAPCTSARISSCCLPAPPPAGQRCVTLPGRGHTEHPDQGQVGLHRHRGAGEPRGSAPAWHDAPTAQSCHCRCHGPCDWQRGSPQMLPAPST